MARQIALREREQLTVELELKKSEFHFRSIFENSLFGIAVVGIDLKFSQVNDAFCRLIGYTEGEVVGGMGLADVTYPDDVAASLDMVQKIFTLELDHYLLEKRYLSKNGNCMEVMLFVQGIYDEYAVCTGATASVLDVTERKKAVEVLKESEENLRALMEAMPVGVGFYDEERRIEYLNPCFVDWFGYTREDIPTVDAWYLKAYPDPIHREKYIERLDAETSEARLHGTPVAPIDATITCKNGSVRRVIISYQLSQRRRLAIFTDITERELQQNELLKAQKLESLGVLAGGIAHDFNNVLTGIMGNISLAQMYLELPHRACKPLEQAEKASKRAAELAYQLLTFAKGGNPVKTAVCVQNLVHEAVFGAARGEREGGCQHPGRPPRDTGRRGADQPDLQQHHHQRRAGYAAGRDVDRGGAERGACRQKLVAAAGRTVRANILLGPGERHECRGAGKDLRSLFHHKA